MNAHVVEGREDPVVAAHHDDRSVAAGHLRVAGWDLGSQVVADPRHVRGAADA